MPAREIGTQRNIYNAVTYEVSRDRKHYYRKVYNSLDLLAELGGLFGSFYTLSMSFVVIATFAQTYHSVTEDTFFDSDRY